MKQKSIALVLIVFMFACNSYNPKISVIPHVAVSSVENISNSSGTLIAYITPTADDSTVVVFHYLRYQNNDSTWIRAKYPIKLSGVEEVKVTLNLTDLSPKSLYFYKVSATNTAGTTLSKVNSFMTDGPTNGIIQIKPVTNIGISTAKICAVVIPNQFNSTITYEYQEGNSDWETHVSPTSYSGKDSINIEFNLYDLKPNTNYKYRLKVTNIGGVAVSDTRTFMTYATKDFDGNLYHTVTIGTQTWLKENFTGTHFANGDAIPNVINNDEWNGLSSPAFCYYNNDPKNGEVYGGLYNWYAASDPRGLILGYHTPTASEFETLRFYLTSNFLTGDALRTPGILHWKRDCLNSPNSTGFSALAGGIRLSRAFSMLKELAIFSSSTQALSLESDYASEFYLYYGNVSLESNQFFRITGKSIRLVRND